MRLASLKRDFWQLQSGEESQRDHPDTFWISPLEQRQTLQRGRAARLIFEIEAEDEDGTVVVQRERMWVFVSEQIDDFYIGILDSQPVSLELSDRVYLRLGAEVPFRAEHVIDIAQPPAEYVTWQLSQPPDRAWPRDG